MEPVQRLAGLLAEARSPAAFTGAGMSTESGIPDYRSPGGVWERFQPPALAEFLASGRARARYWRFYQEFFPAFGEARPNPGHLALGRLYAAGRLAGVATQNIDGLHAAGGVPPEAVWELHGNVFTAGCLGCGAWEADTAELVAEFAASGRPPACGRCGGPVKPRTISFGQGLDRAVLEGAARLCRDADLLLVMGSSLAVTPAADLPRLTLEAGGRVAILNRTPTHLDGRAALVAREPAGAALAAAVEELLG
jgi:NAD-dependent deacetylase